MVVLKIYVHILNLELVIVNLFGKKRLWNVIKLKISK